MVSESLVKMTRKDRLTYIPLGESSNTDRNECSLSISRRLDQSRPWYLRCSSLHRESVNDLRHFELNQWVISVSVCVEPSEQFLCFFTSIVRDEPSAETIRTSACPAIQNN